MEYRLPNLIIAGCQKSGTTWTHFALSKLDECYGSTPKELNFINQKDLNLDSYKKNFPITQGKKIYFESTPHYFQLPKNNIDIAGRIKENLITEDNNCNVLVIFRNPVERAISATIHYMMKGRLEYIDVVDDIPKTNLILELGAYKKIHSHWQRVLGSNLFVRLYDDIENDPLLFINGITNELGVTNKLTLEDLKFRVNDKKIKLEKSQINNIPKPSKNLVSNLIEFYKDDIDYLEDIFNKDLAHWRDTDTVLSKYL